MVNEVALNILTFLLGLLLGHRLSLGRDRRKEFNELTREIYIKLNEQIKNKRKDIIPINTALLAHYFNPILRMRFIKAVDTYANTKYDFGKYDPCTGKVDKPDIDIDVLINNAKRVVNYLHPR